jgi:hypothetical protein
VDICTSTVSYSITGNKALVMSRAIEKAPRTAVIYSESFGRYVGGQIGGDGGVTVSDDFLSSVMIAWVACSENASTRDGRVPGRRLSARPPIEGRARSHP